MCLVWGSGLIIKMDRNVQLCTNSKTDNCDLRKKNVDDFNNRNLFLTAKILNKVKDIIKFKSIF